MAIRTMGSLSTFGVFMLAVERICGSTEAGCEKMGGKGGRLHGVLGAIECLAPLCTPDTRKESGRRGMKVTVWLEYTI
jgi:hypothetical protein